MKKNKIVFISGSSRGIGKEIAKFLLESGYTVIINGRKDSSLNKTFKEFSNLFPNKVFSIKADIALEKDIIKIKNSVIKNFGSIDHLVSNVGSGKSKLGLDESIKEFKNMFDINFFNAVMLSKELIPIMLPKKTKNKSITFISSIAGLEYIDCPISYSCSKASLNIYSKSLSKVLGPKNIRVNTISPGNILFEGSTWDKKIKNDKNATKKYIRNNVPLNSFGNINDVASLVEYLISDKSTFITGSNFVIDGGQNNSY